MAKEEGKKLVCKICGKEFNFSKGEQEFYAKKGLQNIPKACPECREVRRQGDKIDIEIKCERCGKKGIFRKRIDAKNILCAECYLKSKEGSDK